uniref:Uncharacterized protein n=1 Tax=Arundo donax TaxID=35708 RepID=A0A0A9C0Q6_ARUDO
MKTISPTRGLGISDCLIMSKEYTSFC